MKTTWDDNDVWAQSQLIAYNQIRDYETVEDQNEMLKLFRGAI